MSLATPPATRRIAVADVAVIALPTALAAVLSLISLTGRSLGFDEGATVAIVSQHGHALWHAIARDGGNMSGYYLLMHLLVGAFGDGPWVLRLPSVVFAAATPGLIGAIGLALFDRRAAGLAGLLSAVSLPLIDWAQTARGYAPMLAFTCAGMLAFVMLVRAEAADERGVGPAVAYVLAMALAAYCSFVAVLIVPAQLLVLAARRRALRRFVGALAALAVLGIPLGILAVRRGSGQLFWLPKPSRQVESQVLQSLTSSGLAPNFHRVFSTTAGWVVTAAAMLVILGLMVAARRSRGRAPGDPFAGWGAAVVMSWVVVPGALAFLYSLVAHPIFLSRNLLISVPAVALALGVALADRRLPRWAATAGVLAALLIRAAPLIASYGVSPEPWRQATAHVLAAARPGDCVAFYPEDGHNAFGYYVARDRARERAPRSVLPALRWSATTPFVEIYATLTDRQIAGLTRGCRRMWLVTSHEGQANGPARSRRNRAGWHALRARLEQAFGHAPTRTFGYASAIHIQLLPGRGH